jgi:hypothetical protein
MPSLTPCIFDSCSKLPAVPLSMACVNRVPRFSGFGQIAFMCNSTGLLVHTIIHDGTSVLLVHHRSRVFSVASLEHPWVVSSLFLVFFVAWTHCTTDRGSSLVLLFNVMIRSAASFSEFVLTMAIVNRGFSKSFFLVASVLLFLSCTIFPSSFLLSPSLFIDHDRASDHGSAIALVEPRAPAQTQRVPIPFGLRDTLRISSPNDTARLLHSHDKRFDTTW